MYSKKDFQKWKQYEEVRQSGEFNMITECVAACKKAKLTQEEYSTIVKKYSFIKSAIEKEYGSVDNFLNA